MLYPNHFQWLRLRIAIPPPPQDCLDSGNLETEDGRMSYTLSRFAERGLPATCVLPIRRLLSCPRVLGHWPSILPELRTQIEKSKAKAIQMMQQTPPSHKRIKRDFITVPVDYEVDSRFPEIALCLWKRSLAELSTQVAESRFTQISTFLGIYAFLRDPIGGLARSFEKQTYLFHELLRPVETLQEGDLSSRISCSVSLLKRRKNLHY